MNIIDYIRRIREAAIVDQDRAFFDSNFLVFSTKTIDERTSGGGLTDTDTYLRIALTPNGWVKRITVEEFGHGPHGNKIDTVHRRDDTEWSDNDVNSYLNSADCEPHEFFSFIEKYNELAEILRLEKITKTS